MMFARILERELTNTLSLVDQKELSYKQMYFAKCDELTELRGLADAFSKCLEVEKDDAAFANVYAFKIALTNYKSFLARHNL